MTLFITLILLHHFGYSWPWFIAALVLWIAEKEYGDKIFRSPPPPLPPTSPEADGDTEE